MDQQALRRMIGWNGHASVGRCDASLGHAILDMQLCKLCLPLHTFRTCNADCINAALYPPLGWADQRGYKISKQDVAEHDLAMYSKGL